MSTTVLETFDTQMLDYQNDTDFSMHLSSSDLWLHEEAPMEDDGRTLPSENLNLNTSVEVDMEPYDDDNQNPEYEMEDGSENFNNDSVDVEVYDVSRAHSPDTILGHESSVLLASDSTHLAPFAAESPEAASSNHDHLIGLDADNVSPPPPGAQQSSASSPQHPQPAPGSADTVQSGHIGELETPQQSQFAETPPTDLQDPVYESLTSVSEEAPQVRNVDVGIIHPGIGSDDIQEGLEVPDTLEAPASADAAAESVADKSPQYELPDKEKLDSSSASTGGDPHEISEGVYIDPPPAVLVSLSADHSLISLFNAPSELANTLESDTSARVVLLGHLPTLYYEPLSSVFDALRQDEYIRDIPGLLNGELILDAYDLELVMSEDYIFAHEFSLHDLNVLHDGLNNSGPLRLRLKAVLPRFIDRYQLLQEQIAQVQISDGEAVVDAQEVHEPHSSEPEESVDREEIAETTLDDGMPDEKLSEGLSEPPAGRESEQGVGELPPDAIPGVHEELDGVDQSKDGDNISRRPSITVHSTRTKLAADVVESPVPEVQDGETEEGQTFDEPLIHEHDDNDTHQALQDEDEHEPLEEDLSSTLLVTEHRHKNETEEETPNPQPSIMTSVVAASNGLLALTGDNTPGIAKHLDMSDSRDEPEEPDSLTLQTDQLPAVGHIVTNVEEELDHTAVTVAEPEISETGDASYDLEAWDDTLDGEGELDVNWDIEEHEHETASNQSSATLSSKTSAKRSLSEAELEEYEDDEPEPSSTDFKRPRVD